MKAVILAGGKGTRLGDLSKDIPKPMVTVGTKPILEHQIELLVRFGFTEVFIIVNHLKDSIIEHFQDGSKFGIKISYYQESSPLGTVGGLKEIENNLTDDFLVLYGDVMMDMDLERLIKFHQAKNSEATLVLHPNDHPHDSDLVEMDKNSKIIAFYSKPHNPNIYYHNMVNAGAYVFSPKIFKHLQPGVKADFGKDIFPNIVSKLELFGYNTSEYLKDMGTPERLKQVNEDFSSGFIQSKSFVNKQKAVFLDRDGVINKEVSYLHKPEQFELYDYTALAINKLNKAGFVNIVTTNQSSVARNYCSESELSVIHKKMDSLLGQSGAKVDALYYCPHLFDNEATGVLPEYNIDCNCRKPKSGMIQQAVSEFNIDCSQSFVIGDSDRDIISGKNMGCTGIGVRTGHGMKNSSIKPDYLFNNLKEAVDFIVDEPYLKYYQQVLSLYKYYITYTRNPKLFVIIVAGQTRSGKTTFTTYLQKKLNETGLKTKRIQLDNWILPKEKRENWMNVYDRFQVNKIVEDLDEILLGKTIKLNNYKIFENQKDNIVEYSLTNEKILLLDGIVGLGHKSLRENPNIKIFLDISPELLKRRIEEFYRWRGHSENEITELYNKRSVDEYSLIEQDKQYADFKIKSI